jgi:predicted nucleic-acid-binding protein
MGIIDILQKYNTGKIIESLFKTKQHLLDRAQSEVSAVNSKAYKKRFDEFMDEIIKPKGGKTRRRRRNIKKRTRKL